MTDYTTSVLSDVLAELRIGRDSTKGSLAEQVAHELRAALSRPTPTASAAPTNRQEIADLWDRYDEERASLRHASPLTAVRIIELGRKTRARIEAALSQPAAEASAARTDAPTDDRASAPRGQDWWLTASRAEVIERQALLASRAPAAAATPHAPTIAEWSGGLAAFDDGKLCTEAQFFLERHRNDVSVAALAFMRELRSRLLKCLAVPPVAPSASPAAPATLGVDPDTGVSYVIGAKLTEDESRNAASLFRTLQQHNDPYALDRVIEVVIVSRRASSGVGLSDIERVARACAECVRLMGQLVKIEVDAANDELPHSTYEEAAKAYQDADAELGAAIAALTTASA